MVKFACFFVFFVAYNLQRSVLTERRAHFCPALAAVLVRGRRRGNNGSATKSEGNWQRREASAASAGSVCEKIIPTEVGETTETGALFIYCIYFVHLYID